MTALGERPRVVTRSNNEAGSRRLLLSRIAVIVLALFAFYDCLNTIGRWFSPAGFIGIYIDGATGIVVSVDQSTQTTGLAGIKVGDQVDLSAMPFRERSYLYEGFNNVVEPAGLRVTVPLMRKSHRTTLTITVAPVVKPAAENFWSWTRRVVATISIATGVILVWNRPIIMLWGLALVLMGAHDDLLCPFTTPVIAGLLIFGNAIISALELPGLIAFAARFPDGRGDRATRFYDVAAAGLLGTGLLYYCYYYIPLFTARPMPDLPDLGYSFSAVYLAVVIALCVKLRKNRSNRTGLGWIVAGLGVGIVIGDIALSYLIAGLPDTQPESMWLPICQQILKLALPASVAYSLIRYRSFGLGYLTNRSLVFASLTVGAVSAFLIGIWVMSSRLSSTLGIGVAMFFALLIGMTFVAQRRRAIRFVDRVFLPHRYEAGLTLDRIRETLRGTNDARRAAGEVAATLGLASVAVFERASDGGFVRNAAYGWPTGTAWHLLPGERLTHSLEDGATVVALPDEVSGDHAFPKAEARPRVALTIRRGGRVERAVFIGPYRDGARFDRDAIRSMHGVFDDALGV